MIKALKKYNVAGFSLVELMVVVAIIGILAAVAIPNFNRFQRRARAAEGKTGLGSLYNAQKAFQTEWEGYYTSLVGVGFSIDGTTRTNVGFNAAAAPSAAGNHPTRYAAEAVAAFGNTNNAAYDELANAAVCGGTFAPGCTLYSGGVPAITVGTMNNATAVQTFSAHAATNTGGSTAAGEYEEWRIDHNKQLVQTSDGVNW